VLETGAGICFNGLTSDLYFPLGHYTSVFQAETHAIMQCALALKRLDSSDEHICICSDSQAVLMALCNPRVVSKQIWECIGALSELASHRPVSLTCVPAHSGIPGNEQVDHLAKTASCQPYIGSEPALPMPYNAVKTAIRQWHMYRQIIAGKTLKHAGKPS